MVNQDLALSPRQQGKTTGENAACATAHRVKSSQQVSDHPRKRTPTLSTFASSFAAANLEAETARDALAIAAATRACKSSSVLPAEADIIGTRTIHKNSEVLLKRAGAFQRNGGRRVVRTMMGRLVAFSRLGKNSVETGNLHVRTRTVLP